MTKEQELKLRKIYETTCTDSDIEDFCDENELSRKEAFHKIAIWSAPECCNGCRHVDMFPDMFPCVSCSRAKKDRYEKEDEYECSGKVQSVLKDIMAEIQALRGCSCSNSDGIIDDIEDIIDKYRNEKKSL